MQKNARRKKMAFEEKKKIGFEKKSKREKMRFEEKNEI